MKRSAVAAVFVVAKCREECQVPNGAASIFPLSDLSIPGTSQAGSSLDAFALTFHGWPASTGTCQPGAHGQQEGETGITDVVVRTHGVLEQKLALREARHVADSGRRPSGFRVGKRIAVQPFTYVPDCPITRLPV